MLISQHLAPVAICLTINKLTEIWVGLVSLVSNSRHILHAVEDHHLPGIMGVVLFGSLWQPFSSVGVGGVHLALSERTLSAV